MAAERARAESGADDSQGGKRRAVSAPFNPIAQTSLFITWI
jgi:hypothetical protein